MAVSQESTENGTGMTHLPECPSVNYFGLHARSACICRWLRACEQRVTTEALQKAKAREANGITWAQAYAAALRDAVEAVKLCCSADIELVERTEVIAAIEAIEALKEKL